MRRILYAFSILTLVGTAACTGPKKTIYFNESTALDSSVQFQNTQPRPDIIVQPDDILAVNISSISSISSANPVSIFNEGGTQYMVVAGGASGVGGGAQQISGFLVDKQGFIDFPVLGKIAVAGKSIRQVKEQMALRLKDYMKEPVVEVRIVNYKVTMLGEVGRVGPILAPNHKINILEAVAAAGDIPLTGRKDNILIIREVEGKREYGRINLNSKNVFNSPYYYLQQNDIIYVEPSRIRRQETNEFLRFYLPTITTLLSSAVTIYGIIKLTAAQPQK